MKKKVVVDKQLGQIRWDDTLGCYKTQSEWSPGVSVELWLNVNKNNLSANMERYKNMIKTMKDNESSYLELTAQNLLEVFNDILVDNEISKVDANEFIDSISLSSIIINEDGDSFLTYVHGQGVAPLVVITVSNELGFKNAVFD